MFAPVTSFSGYSVNDLEQARTFYADTLGLPVEDAMGGLRVGMPGGNKVYVYVKPDHQAATYTVCNFVVENIDESVADLAGKGIVFERYEGMPQDDAGIMRGKAAQMGPDIAWFKDPAGNVLSVLQD